MYHLPLGMYKSKGNFRKFAGIFLIVAMLLALVPATALAVPQIPLQLYGDVIIGGSPAPDGIKVEAKIDGISYVVTNTKDGRYGYEPVFLIPADDPDTDTLEGGIEGDSVVLYVGGMMEAVVKYAYGAVINMGLSVDTLQGPSAPVNIIGNTAVNDNTPAFSWEEPVNAPGVVDSYEVKIDVMEWINAGSGFSYTFTDILSDGSHVFQVRAVDKLGTKGDIGNLEFLIDATMPGIPVNIIQITPYNDSTPSFTWDPATDAISSIESYQVRIDGGAWKSIGNVTSYTHSVTVGDGLSHIIQVRAVDSAGNNGEPGEAVFIIDITPPGIVGELTRTSAYNDKTPAFLWTASSDATSGVSAYEARMDTGAWVNVGSVLNYTWTSEIIDGNHIFYVRAVDVAGNYGAPYSLAFAIDATPPGSVVSITKTTPDNKNAPAFIWITVSDAASYEVKMDSGGWSNLGNANYYSISSALTDGSHLFQVRAIDSAGNAGVSGSLIFIVDTVAPAVPDNLVKTTPDNNNTPTFTWKAPDDVTSGVLYYEVRIDKGLWIKTLSVATTYNYSVSLADGNHNFEVRAVDGAGNTGSTKGLDFSIDATKPEVSVLSPNGGEYWAGGSVHNIQWLTLDGKKGSVDIDYSINGGVIWTAIIKGAADTGNFLWTLPEETNTSQGRVRITANDAAGNSAADSSDANFRIDSTPPSIIDAAALEIGITNANIFWNTSEPSTTQLEYGTTIAYGMVSKLNTTLVTEHTVFLIGLTPGVTYHYRVKSVDASGNTGISIDRTFTTVSASTTVSITGVTVTGVTASSAIIGWITSPPSDGKVEYGLTDAYGMITLLDTTESINHSMSITGLLSGTAYHFRVISKGAVSGDGTFTTLTDNISPVISNVSNSGKTASHAIISWNSSEPANSRVEYGKSPAAHGGYEYYSPVNTLMLNYHSMALAGLSASTTYYYRVISQDASGNETVSDEYSFITLPDSQAPGISGVISSGLSTDSAVISWVTNELASGQVEYGTAAATYSFSTSLNTVLSLGHSAGIEGLTPNTIYYFRAKSADAAGNQVVSAEYSFTTLADAEEPEISDIVVANISGNSAIVIWNTSEKATTKVVYDVASHASDLDYASSFPSPADASAVSLGHGVVLSGLIADTTYYCRVVSTDAYGNKAVSDEFNFVTEDIIAPAISLVSAVAINFSGAVVVWATDEDATTQVIYGLTSHSGDTYANSAAAIAAYGSSTLKDSILTESHAQVLTGLTTGTTYYFRVVSIDASGNEKVSGQYSFTTTS